MSSDACRRTCCGALLALLLTAGAVNVRAQAGRAEMLLPTVRTAVVQNGAELYAIKADGTVWVRTFLADILQFSPEQEVTVARGARAFGESMVAMVGGGMLTRQPGPALAPGEGWVSAQSTAALASESGAPGQNLVDIYFPSRFLFSGGLLVHTDGALGQPAAGRLAGTHQLSGVARFGVNAVGLTALLGSGSVVSTSSGGNTSCVIPSGAVSLALGPRHGVAALTDGTVRMWGDLSLGQLGQAGAAGAKAVQVPGLHDIIEVATFWNFGVLALGVDRRGDVWMWGSLGPQQHIAPKKVPGLSNVAYVDFGVAPLALRTDGSVLTFDILNRVPPVQVFNGVKPVERLPVGASNTSVCGTPPMSPLPTVPAVPQLPRRPRQSVPAFIVSNRFTCQQPDGTPAGDVTITTRSTISCQDATNRQHQLRRSKGGDFCASAVPGTNTFGAPVPLITGTSCDPAGAVQP